MGFMNTEARFKHEFVETYQDGDAIFEEGDIGKDLYIVQKGKVRITKKIGNSKIEIAEFEKGDFFGDMSLLQSIPRYASAHANGPTKVLILQPAGFLLKIRRDPTFAFEMLQQMSLRIKVSNDRLVELVKQNEISIDQVQGIINAFGGKI